MHNGALARGDFGGETPPSFYFRLMAPEENLEPAQKAKSDPIWVR